MQLRPTIQNNKFESWMDQNRQGKSSLNANLNKVNARPVIRGKAQGDAQGQLNKNQLNNLRHRLNMFVK